MSKCGNSFLGYKDFATNRAVLTFSKSCVYTIGINSGINNFGVTKCGNYLLSEKNRTTDRALFTLGKSGFSAGSRVVRNDFFRVICAEICITCITDIILGIFVGVTKCGNSFLCYNDFTTIRAVFTFSKTDFGTSGCLCLVNYFGMTLCRRKLSLTYGTNLCVKAVCLIACSMTKCRNNLLCNLIVAS